MRMAVLRLAELGYVPSKIQELAGSTRPGCDTNNQSVLGGSPPDRCVHRTVLFVFPLVGPQLSGSIFSRLCFHVASATFKQFRSCS